MTTPDPRLSALGFKPVGAVKGGRRRIFLSYEGPPSSGKSDFIRRCPPPQVVIDMDMGLEGVAEYDIWGNQILRYPIEMPDLDEFSKKPSLTERTIAMQSYAKFKSLMEETMKLDMGGTLMIETGGAAYALAQIARFGQIAQVGEVQAAMWTSMQAEFERIFLQYERYNWNLIVSHRQGGKFMGLKDETELKGYKPMMNLAQVHLNFERRPIRDERGKVVDFELVRSVVKSRQRLALLKPDHPQHEFPVIFLDDEKRESVGGDFATIVQAVFPNTTPADWFPADIAAQIG